MSSRKHLFEHHDHTVTCCRCYRWFRKEADLHTHVRAVKTCNLIEPGRGCFMSNELWERIETRQKAEGVKSLADKWRVMYHVMFPFDDPIPAPCELQQFLGDGLEAHLPLDRDLSPLESIKDFVDHLKHTIPTFASGNAEQLVAPQQQDICRTYLSKTLDKFIFDGIDSFKQRNGTRATRNEPSAVMPQVMLQSMLARSERVSNGGHQRNAPAFPTQTGVTVDRGADTANLMNMDLSTLSSNAQFRQLLQAFLSSPENFNVYSHGQFSDSNHGTAGNQLFSTQNWPASSAPSDFGGGYPDSGWNVGNSQVQSTAHGSFGVLGSM